MYCIKDINYCRDAKNLVSVYRGWDAKYCHFGRRNILRLYMWVRPLRYFLL